MSFTVFNIELSTKWLLLFSGASASIFLVRFFGNDGRRKSLPLPPGPKPSLLTKNLSDVPTRNHAEVYREMADKYGDLIYLEPPLFKFLVLNSFDDAAELLEKRSSIYSDRATFTMTGLLSWDWSMPFIRYGPEWRDQRKAFHQQFNEGVVERFASVQRDAVRVYLRRWVTSKSQDIDFQGVVYHLFAANILQIVYGKEVEDHLDTLVEAATVASKALSSALLPGAYWIEFFPYISFLPAWTPGAYFKKFAEKKKPYVLTARDKPFELVWKAAKHGIASPSVTQGMIQEMNLLTDDAQYRTAIARNSAGTAYSAAVDTTTSTALSFLVAMAKFPEIQRKAQTSLDALLGVSTFPKLSDLESLPYVRAIYYEVLRYMPVAPLGLAHSSTTDDSYKGYFIPKGTIVFPNQWAMLRNPKEYPNPEVFSPERFLNNDGSWNSAVFDPREVAFGFGRRICPGRFLAENSLLLFIASTLYTCDIVPKTNWFGKPIEISLEMTNDASLISPIETRCRLVPRSDVMRELILQEEYC